MHQRGALRLLPRQALPAAEAEPHLRVEPGPLLQPHRGGKHRHATRSERSHCPSKFGRKILVEYKRENRNAKI